MTMRMKKLFSILAVAATVLLTACDEHQDFPDTAMKVTHILTTDGKVMPYETYEQSCKQAIAVVFNVNQREEMEGNGYAVYLWDIAPEAFADSDRCGTGPHPVTSPPTTATRTLLPFMARPM